VVAVVVMEKVIAHQKKLVNQVDLVVGVLSDLLLEEQVILLL
tara:strand:- start:364 stop:489 length:126 start_codon:yes stop_codon:yes gene_type:complete